MNWESRYLPPDPLVWHGRADLPEGACFHQHTQLLNLLTDKPLHRPPCTFAIIGFKSDEGAQRDLGRTGAYEGPAAIRQRLIRLPIQTTAFHLYDAGNIICNDHDLEASQAALAEIVAMLLKQQIRPIILGGGHEVAWGHYQGIAKTYPPQKRLGIINIDAHFDLQPMHPSNRGSATTVFHQIAEAQRNSGRHLDLNYIGVQHTGNIRQLFDIAKTNQANIILADDLHQGQKEKCIDFIDRIVDENDIIYASLSLDVFSPAFAPGVSTIQPLGLDPWHIIPFLRQLAASGKVIGYDIAEHVPLYDIDHRTAKLAASLVHEIIHHHADSTHTTS